MKSSMLVHVVVAVAVCALTCSNLPGAAAAPPPAKAPAPPAPKVLIDERLAKAVIDEDLPKVAQLLAAGSSANANGRTAMGLEPVLTMAAGSGNVALMNLLLDKGADPNGRGPNGLTPLMRAALIGEPEHVKLLLHRGANVNGRGKSEQTPLLAAIGFSTENVKLLLERGADPNAAMTGGITPLMATVITSDLEAARLLLAKGAKVGPKDKKGRTALQVAREELRDADAEGRAALKQFIQLLQRHGAK